MPAVKGLTLVSLLSGNFPDVSTRMLHGDGVTVAEVIRKEGANIRTALSRQRHT